MNFSGTAFLKAIAILAVILIHTLSSIQPSPFVNSSEFQLLTIILDQLARISVPLFVAISGYGLAQSCAKQSLSFFDFFKRRIMKILPLYFIWSVIFAFIFYLIPTWAPATQQPNLVWQLVLGRADYHLYFVPMIFQLYLFFPLIFFLFKKWPHYTFIMASLIQLVWWWFFSYQEFTVTTWKYFAGDGEQYLWMSNWIGYFVLGMYLPKVWKIFDKKKILILLTFATLFCSILFMVNSAIQAIQGEIDPLFALKFTRYPVFIYSVIAISLISYFAKKIKKFPNIIVLIGNNSYFLYLSHTLFLRVIFWWLYR